MHSHLISQLGCDNDGAVNLHVCRHNPLAAMTVTSCFGNNSTYHVKVSMITIMYVKVTYGKGLIVSIEVRSIYLSVESTNREERSVLLLASISSHVG